MNSELRFGGCLLVAIIFSLFIVWTDKIGHPWLLLGSPVWLWLIYWGVILLRNFFTPNWKD
jgi:hypothetical protein